MKSIIKHYENYSSIINIKNHIDSPATRSDIPTAKIEDINKIIKNINPKKATGPDKIPPNIVRLLAKIIDSHLMISVIILSQTRQKLQQFDEPIKRKIPTKLKITDLLAY